MPTNRIAGAVLVVIGVVLLGFAWNASDAPLEEISESLTGRYSDRTMWYFIAGIAAVIGGGLLALVGKRR